MNKLQKFMVFYGVCWGFGCFVFVCWLWFCALFNKWGNFVVWNSYGEAVFEGLGLFSGLPCVVYAFWVVIHSLTCGWSKKIK